MDIDVGGPPRPRSPLSSLSPSAVSSDVRFYLTVYGSLAAANTVFTALRAFLFAYGAVGAAAAVHDRLLDRVLQVSRSRVPFLNPHVVFQNS